MTKYRVRLNLCHLGKETGNYTSPMLPNITSNAVEDENALYNSIL